MFGNTEKRPSRAYTVPLSESIWRGEICAGNNSLRKRRDTCGQILRFANGDTIARTNANTIIVRNAQGQIYRTVDDADHVSEFIYDDSGSLLCIKLSTGTTIHRREDGTWFSPDSGKNFESDFEVRHDGTLGWYEQTTSGKKLRRQRLADGTLILTDANGRSSVIRCDLTVQHEKLKNILSHLLVNGSISSQRYGNFLEALEALRMRSRNGHIPEPEVAKTFFHIARMLESREHCPISKTMRVVVAHELAFFAGLPSLLRAEDGIVSLARELFMRRPSYNAMLVAQLATDSLFITNDGFAVFYQEESMCPSSENQDWSTWRLNRRSCVLRVTKILRAAIVQILKQSKRHRECDAAALPEDASNEGESQRVTTRELGEISIEDLFQVYRQITGDYHSDLALFVDPPLQELRQLDPSASMTRMIPKIAASCLFYNNPHNCSPAS